MDVTKRSHTMLNNFNSIEDLLPDDFKKQSIVMEKRPLTDVYEVESYKEFNKMQYAEVLRYSSHYQEGATLRDHAFGILASGQEIVEENCTIFWAILSLLIA